MRNIFVMSVVCCAGFLCSNVLAAQSQWPIYVFDNYMSAAPYNTHEARAAILKETGYDGVSYHGTKGIVEFSDALKKAGLTLFATYCAVNIDAEQKYDPHLLEGIKQLKGSDTMIWLFFTSGKYKDVSPEADKITVDIVRQIADAAHESNLKIALYPHTGFYLESFDDTLRIARKVNRRNVGVSFNLCHFLKVEGDIDYVPALKKAKGYLFQVTINGADSGNTKAMGWDRLILTLDRGSFDNYKFLKALKAVDYTGPVGLQGYAIKGDPKENLQRSIKAWRQMNERLIAEQKK